MASLRAFRIKKSSGPPCCPVKEDIKKEMEISVG
jgi:hypothetical protein